MSYGVAQTVRWGAKSSQRKRRRANCLPMRLASTRLNLESLEARLTPSSVNPGHPITCGTPLQQVAFHEIPVLRYFQAETITNTSASLSAASDPAKNNWTLGTGSEQEAPRSRRGEVARCCRSAVMFLSHDATVAFSARFARLIHRICETNADRQRCRSA